MSFHLIIIYFLTLILIPILLRLSGSNILRANFISPFIISYLIFSYVGYPLIFYKNSRYSVEHYLVDSSYLEKSFLFSTISILIVVLSYSFFVILQKKKTNNFKIQELSKINKYRSIFILFISIFFLCYYVFSLDNLAIIDLFIAQNSAEIGLIRSEGTNSLVNSWRFHFFPKYVLTAMSYVFIIDYFKNKSSSMRILMIISVLSTIFYCIMNVMKGPLLFYLWSLVFLYQYLFNFKLRLKHIISFSLFSLLFITSLLFLITNSNLSSIFEGIVNRVFAGSLSSSYYYVKIFPESLSFLGGLSLPNPMGILPFEHFELTKFMSLEMFGLNELGAVGSAPAPYWAEMYANFGLIGILLGSILIGMIFSIIHYYFKSNIKSNFNLALFVFLAFQFREISTSGFFELLFPFRIIILLLIFYIIKINFKIKKNETIAN